MDGWPEPSSTVTKIRITDNDRDMTIIDDNDEESPIELNNIRSKSGKRSNAILIDSFQTTSQQQSIETNNVTDMESSSIIASNTTMDVC